MNDYDYSFYKAQAEYEAKMFDPYGDEYDEDFDPESAEESYVELMIDAMKEED